MVSGRRCPNGGGTGKSAARIERPGACVQERVSRLMNYYPGSWRGSALTMLSRSTLERRVYRKIEERKEAKHVG